MVLRWCGTIRISWLCAVCILEKSLFRGAFYLTSAVRHHLLSSVTIKRSTQADYPIFDKPPEQNSGGLSLAYFQ
jgi:hypothetical protein